MSRTMTMSEAINEARRCLNCAAPNLSHRLSYRQQYPSVHPRPRRGQHRPGLRDIAERSNLPAICGRVCPHERQCEAHCVLTKNKHGIEIGSLEMFIADFAHENNLKPLPPSTASVAR